MIADIVNISKSFKDDVILNGLSFSIEDGAKIGLVGQNGCGKTTLLNILCDKSQDSGEIRFKSGASVGYLRQNDALDIENSIADEMRLAFLEALAAKKRMDEISELLAISPEYENKDALLSELGQVQNIFTAAGGYEMEYKIEAVLNGMGFKNVSRGTKIVSMSGGERTRLALCKMLLQNPDLLLLDEPTNHLDFESLTWLEEYLKSCKSALVVVSHDRYFLDAVATEIFELQEAKLSVYRGNYTKYKELKEARIKLYEKELFAYKKEKESLTDYVNRNLQRASTSAMAKSRQKALEKLEPPEKVSEPLENMSLSFPFDIAPSKEVLTLKDFSLAIGESGRVLIDSLDFTLFRGDKIGIVGQNGTGKTSLIRALLGKLPHCGRAIFGQNVKISYYDQGNIALHLEKTAIDEMHDRFPKMDVFELRSALARSLFKGDDVYKKVKSLSGGERARLRFALLSLERPNLLIMDEPTNHLDISGREALERALINYEGTLILISHDRYLLSKVPNRIIELDGGKVNIFTGSYSDYKAAKSAPSPVPFAPEKEKIAEKKNPPKSERAERAKARQRIGDCEKEILKMEMEIFEIGEKLSDENTDYMELQRLYERSAFLEKELDKAYETWEELAQQKDE